MFRAFSDVWKLEDVMIPWKAGQEPPVLGFDFPLSGTLQELIDAIKVHTGEAAVLLDTGGAPQGVIDPSMLTTLMWEEIRRLSSSM